MTEQAEKANPLDTAYQSYLAAPGPDSLGHVVKHLAPTISYALSNAGADKDPYIKTRARVIAGKAVQTFNPAYGASLPTWTTQQLQQLHRIRRQSQSSVKIPDKILLDNSTIRRAELTFADKFGREPDLEELADHSKLPVSRIQHVRRSLRRVVSSSAFGDQGLPMQDTEDPLLDEASSYVYKDADRIDRRILEMKTGYGGKYEPMDALTIAQKLGLHPSMLSRRSARLGLKIQETRDALGGDR